MRAKTLRRLLRAADELQAELEPVLRLAAGPLARERAGLPPDPAQGDRLLAAAALIDEGRLRFIRRALPRAAGLIEVPDWLEESISALADWADGLLPGPELTRVIVAAARLALGVG